MNIIIKNKFDRYKVDNVINFISSRLASEEHLTKRSLSEIKDLIRKEETNCQFDNNKIISFIFKERLNDSYFELGGWFIEPRYRSTGTAKKLFNHVIGDTKYNLIFFSYNNQVIDFALKKGFTLIKFSDLPFLIKLKLILKRFKLIRIIEILRHKKKSNWKLLIKYAT